MADEVAVFIDLENLRYSLLNLHGHEPDFNALVEKARKYGRLTLMRAYADFTEHPDQLTRQLQVTGIEAINVPVKRIKITKAGKEVERVKNAADMVMALDAVTEAVDADQNNKVKTFMIVSGDRDYVKLVTQLRNKFGQSVVITGVPGSIAPDLVSAAGGKQDPVEVVASDPADMEAVKKAIVAMVSKGPKPLVYWSVKIIDQWAQGDQHDIPGNAREKREAIWELLDKGVLVRQERPNPKRPGQMVNEAILDRDAAKQQGYLD